MDIAPVIRSLANFPSVLRPIVADLTDAEARWKPANGAWSVLEIVTHLADEEVEDFRTRLRLTLEDPTAAWPGIDPEACAVERRYNDGDLNEAVDRFVRERETSIAWLKALGDPRWDQAHPHPRIGSIAAGSLLASWGAHDMLHLRQIAKRRFELVQQAMTPYATGYAGQWSS
jgi:hypothetical protein